MNVALALAFLLSAVLAWPLARRDRAHRPLVVFFGALAAVHAASAVVMTRGSVGDAVALAEVAVAAFGLWALAQAVMEERARALSPLMMVPPALGALLVALAFVPAFREARGVVEEAAWTIGIVGAIASIQRALRRGTEPRLGHLLVLAFTALAATRLGVGPDAGWTPQAFGAGAAILTQTLTLVKERRAADGVDVRPEQLRADGRGGDLVDMEPSVRGRPTREARTK